MKPVLGAPLVCRVPYLVIRGMLRLSRGSHGHENCMKIEVVIRTFDIRETGCDAFVVSTIQHSRRPPTRHCHSKTPHAPTFNRLPSTSLFAQDTLLYRDKMSSQMSSRHTPRVAPSSSVTPNGHGGAGGPDARRRQLKACRRFWGHRACAVLVSLMRSGG